MLNIMASDFSQFYFQKSGYFKVSRKEKRMQVLMFALNSR